MVVEKELLFSQVAIDRKLIYSGMGSDGYVPDREMKERIEGMISEISAFARPRFTYRLLDVEGTDKSGITVAGTRFRTGSVIAPYFADAPQIAVFIATTGVEFDEWLHGHKNGGDILDEFVADAIGSAFAEGVVEAAVADLSASQGALGNAVSNSYSPGYCGWNVTTQRDLFAFFKEAPCGVTLNDSCLMSPIKSVSGFVAVGPAVVKHPYGCEICDKLNCFRKQQAKPRPSQPEEWPCSPE